MHLDLIDALIGCEQRTIRAVLQFFLQCQLGGNALGFNFLGGFLAADVINRDAVFVDDVLGFVGVLGWNRVAVVHDAFVVDPGI